MKRTIFVVILQLGLSVALAQRLGTPHQDAAKAYRMIGTTYVSDPENLGASEIRMTHYREQNMGQSDWNPTGRGPYSVPESYSEQNRDELTKGVPEGCPQYPLRLTDLRGSYNGYEDVDDTIAGALAQDCHFEMNRVDCFDDLAYGTAQSGPMGEHMEKLDCCIDCIRAGNNPDEAVLCRDNDNRPSFRIARGDRPYSAPDQNSESYGMFDANRFPGSSIAIKPGRYGVATRTNGNNDNTDYRAQGMKGNQQLTMFVPFSKEQSNHAVNVKFDSTGGVLTVNEDISEEARIVREKIVQDRLEAWAQERQAQLGNGNGFYFTIPEALDRFFNPGVPNGERGIDKWKEWTDSESAFTASGKLPKVVISEIYGKMKEFLDEIKPEDLGYCFEFAPVSTHYTPKLALTPHIQAPGPNEVATRNSSGRNAEIRSRLFAGSQSLHRDNDAYEQAYGYGYGDGYAKSDSPAPALDCPMSDWAYSRKYITDRESCTQDAPAIGKVEPDPAPTPNPGIIEDELSESCRCDGNNGTLVCYNDLPTGQFVRLYNCAGVANGQMPSDAIKERVSCEHKIKINGVLRDCCVPGEGDYADRDIGYVCERMARDPEAFMRDFSSGSFRWEMKNRTTGADLVITK